MAQHRQLVSKDLESQRSVGSSKRDLALAKPLRRYDTHYSDVLETALADNEGRVFARADEVIE